MHNEMFGAALKAYVLAVAKGTFDNEKLILSALMLLGSEF
jgi:hypothetical protein